MNTENQSDKRIEVKPRCKFKQGTELQCKKPPRIGLSTCHQHRRYERAGRPATNPSTIVKQQIAANKNLNERVKELVNSGADLMDLRVSLATFSLMSNDLREKYDSTGELDEKLINLLLALQESNRKTVETIERIKNSTALTTAEVGALSAVLTLMLDNLHNIYEQSISADDFVTRARAQMLETIQLVSQKL